MPNIIVKLMQILTRQTLKKRCRPQREKRKVQYFGRFYNIYIYFENNKIGIIGIIFYLNDLA